MAFQKHISVILAEIFSKNFQNLIKHAIMLTAFNSIQPQKRLQATFEEGIMQISVNLTNQRQRISSLLVSLRPTNASNTDEGLEPDFIISALKKKAEEKRREEKGDKWEIGRWRQMYLKTQASIQSPINSKYQISQMNGTR